MTVTYDVPSYINIFSLSYCIIVHVASNPEIAFGELDGVSTVFDCESVQRLV